MRHLPTMVNAVNQAHKYANELHKTLTDIFKNFVGQKVITKEGKLVAKINLPSLPCTPSLHVFKESSNYSLVYKVRTFVCDTNGSSTYETAVYIGRISDGFLTELCDYEECKDNYTLEQVKALIESYQEKQKAAEQAKSLLYPFGEYA